MMKSEIFVSVVLTVNNQVDQLIDYLTVLSPYLEKTYTDYEIVIIDQRSTDGIEEKLSVLLTVYQSIRHIRLSQAVADDVAFAAGIENAIGDFVVTVNIETDHHEMIGALVDTGQSGSDIVICTSDKVTSLSYRCLRQCSNQLLRSIGYTLPCRSTGSFCLSRRAVNAITETGRFYCKLHMKMANVGYSLHPFPCDKYMTHVQHKSVMNGIKETLHYMVFNSTKPLRWMSLLGMFGSLMAMIFSLYSLIVHFVNKQVAPGWTTTILFMSFLFMLLFIMFSFFGEYLARLLNDHSEHKEYNVIYERNSSVMLDENRNNVLFSSLDDRKNHSQTGRDR